MASYTDTQLPKFTPYIAQQDVELMGKVGMAKQAQYEQGYQKIQDSINRVAGLDIYRDVDKKYLQSKLDELRTNLTTVAAGDFSNFQLTNSVAGMASKIGNDENIINAVASTNNLKKETAFIEEQRKKGLANPSNVDNFTEKTNEWLNNPNPGVQFTAKYSPFVDVHKKWFEALKSLHSDLTEQDIPYVRENGKINYEKTAAAMQRVSTEVLSKEKIETALRAVLTPAEINQLNIDAEYTFKNATPEQLLNNLTQDYTNTIKENDAIIKELKGVAELKTGRPAEREEALKLIKQKEESNEKLREKLKLELPNYEKFVRENPEEAKHRIYIDGAVKQFASPFAWEHNKSNLMTNPYQTQDNWERDYARTISELNFKIDKDKWDRQMDIANYNLRVKEVGIAAAKAEREAKKAEQDANGAFGEFVTVGGSPVDIKNAYQEAKSTLETMQNEGSAIYKEIEKNTGASHTQVREAVNAYATGNSAKIQEANSYIRPEYRDKVKYLVKLRRDQRIASEVLKVSEETAAKSPELAAIKAQYDKEKVKLGNLKLKTPTGVVEFTADELKIYQEKSRQFLEKRKKDSEATPGFTPKEQLFHKYGYTIPVEDRNKYIRLFAKYDKTALNKFDEIKYNTFNEMSHKWQPTLRDITFSSENGDIARRKWESVATSLLEGFNNTFSVQNIDSEIISKEDRKELRTLLTSDARQKLNYKIYTRGNDKELRIMGEGGKTYRLKLDDYQVNQLPIKIDDSWQDVLNAQRAQKGTTNKTGLFEHAWYDKDYFPRTTFNIKADLTTGNQGKTQFVTIRVGSNLGSVVVLPIEIPFNSEESVLEYFKKIDDSAILKSILNAPDYVVSKAVKQEFQQYKK